MKYVINTDSFNKLGLKLEEALVVLLIGYCNDIPKLFKSMLDRDLIRKDSNLTNDFMVNGVFLEKVQKALLMNDPDIPSAYKLENLAVSLMELYPKGKKDGTNIYWRGNKKEIVEKLQKFFKLYGSKYSEEQLINATKKYIESFNGNYSFMRVLKYFIIKDEKILNDEGRGIINQVSDLATFIENYNQEDEINDNWTTELK